MRFIETKIRFLSQKFHRISQIFKNFVICNNRVSRKGFRPPYFPIISIHSFVGFQRFYIIYVKILLFNFNAVG